MTQRALVSTVLELAGMAGIVAGVAMWSVAAALIVAGVGLVLIGLSLAVGTADR